MNALVIIAHPCDDSFSHAAAERAAPPPLAPSTG